MHEFVFGLFGCMVSLGLIGVGFLMRRYDFSVIYRQLYEEDDGLYIRWFFKKKKVAENTPENRMKYSKHLGNYFIGFSVPFLIGSLVMVIYNWGF